MFQEVSQRKHKSCEKLFKKETIFYRGMSCFLSGCYSREQDFDRHCSFQSIVILYFFHFKPFLADFYMYSHSYLALVSLVKLVKEPNWPGANSLRYQQGWMGHRKAPGFRKVGNLQCCLEYTPELDLLCYIYLGNFLETFFFTILSIP